MGETGDAGAAEPQLHTGSEDRTGCRPLPAHASTQHKEVGRSPNKITAMCRQPKWPKWHKLMTWGGGRDAHLMT
jgi:hypothetical protein